MVIVVIGSGKHRPVPCGCTSMHIKVPKASSDVCSLLQRKLISIIFAEQCTGKPINWLKFCILKCKCTGLTHAYGILHPTNSYYLPGNSKHKAIFKHYEHQMFNNKIMPTCIHLASHHLHPRSLPHTHTFDSNNPQLPE